MTVPTKRFIQASGMAYVLLFIAGFAAGPRCDLDGAAAFDICLLNSTPRFGAQFFLHGLAALAFLAFAAELSARMQNAQKGADSLPFLMLGGGLLWSALWLGGIGLAAAASDPGDFQVNAEGARSIFVLTNALLLAEASGLLYLPLALFLWATAMAAKENAVLPTWLRTAATVLALLFVAASGLQLILEAWLVLPMIPLFLFWVVAASIAVLRGAA
jgi:hypothetical protein